MSTFELELDDVQAEPVELDLAPTAEEVQALFEPFEEDYRVLPEREFALELRASLDGSTVLLSGRVAGTFAFTCGRCLEERDIEVASPLEFTVLSRDEWSDTYEGEEEIALEERDLDTSYYEDEVVDLRPLVRDAVMMELPVWPQCPDEARESCDAAYEENVGDDTLEQLEHNSVDLRWWPLRNIDLDDENESGDAAEETLEHDES
jgi:uncharacterized protein